MGNRAVISFGQGDNDPAIYLHWNGGRASVEAFLIAAKEAGITYTDDGPTLDRVAELLASDFFGTRVGFTVYREPYGRTDTDNGDNGVYILDANLDIARRDYVPDLGEEENPKKTQEIVEHIRESRRLRGRIATVPRLVELVEALETFAALPSVKSDFSMSHTLKEVLDHLGREVKS